MRNRTTGVRQLARIASGFALLLAASCGTDVAESVVGEARVEAATAVSTVPPTPTVVPTPVDAVTPVPTVMPPPTATALPTDESAPVRTRLAYGGEPDQFGWLQLPAAPAPTAGHPVVVLIHGGFWREQFDASLMRDIADDLADRGYATWNIEYRRVNGAGGWPETGQDVAAAIEHLAEIGADEPLDLARVVTVGHSAGGHLGLWALGQQDRVEVTGSIGLGAVVDLEYFVQAHALLGGTPDQLPAVYDGAAPVLDPDRVVLIQGSEDRIVPVASLQPALDAQIPVTTIDGDDHFDLIDPTSSSWAATLAAIERFVNLPSR